MGESLNRFFADEAELMSAAAAMAQAWSDAGRSSLSVALAGDLGAGKTTWVRGMLRGLGHTGRVPSPTFTLVEPYQLGNLTILHVDLYRLNEAERELDALGLRDGIGAPDTWVLLEWPERWHGFTGLAEVEVSLALEAAGRRVVVTDKS
jgi:tRNA threonylcarbamoyladenosine biosynthesis protein TsaE